MSHAISTRSLLTLAAVAALLPCALPAQERGTVDRFKVHGRSLVGNLSGDSPDREVTVYLPPGYREEGTRRYPVVYFLHGYTDSNIKWYGFTDHWINLPAVIDKALSGGSSHEMIVVTPNAYTKFQGSMYSSSVTVGDWETYIADELVAYIDSHYRTLPDRASRGLSGHSMGGYGALRIGMKRPDVFSNVYLLSPCCLAPRSSGSGRSAEAMAQAERIQTIEEFEQAGFGVKALIAGAAAWAPNPQNPPFYLDLPYENGEPRPEVIAKLAANAPLAMLDQYIPNIKRLDGLAFDAGDKDAGIAATIRTLDERLDAYGIEHGFEIYDGNHVNRVDVRIETKALPFFSERLAFE